MTPAELWGWFCGVAGTLLALPQLLHILRARTTAGVSLLGWQLWAGIGMGWSVHAVVQSSLQLLLPNFIGGALAGVVVALLQRDRRLGLVRCWALPAAIFLVTGALRLAFGPVVFGVAMVVPQAVAVLGQFVDLVRAPDLSGVSGPYLVYALALQASWLGYGVIASDPAVLISAAAMTVLAGLNVVWFALRRAHLIRARVP